MPGERSRSGASRRPIRAPLPGSTTGRLLGQTLTGTWVRPPLGGRSPPPAQMSFPLPARSASLLLSHSAQPAPWATVSVRAAVPLSAPAFAGYRVSRQITFLERKRPDRLSAGDVLKVRIIVEAPVDRTWVVIEDPVPAGASIVSGGGGQSALLAAQANGGDGWPSYIERGNDFLARLFRLAAQGPNDRRICPADQRRRPLPASADPGRGDVLPRNPRGPPQPPAGGRAVIPPHRRWGGGPCEAWWRGNARSRQLPLHHPSGGPPPHALARGED